MKRRFRSDNLLRFRWKRKVTDNQPYPQVQAVGRGLVVRLHHSEDDQIRIIYSSPDKKLANILSQSQPKYGGKYRNLNLRVTVIQSRLETNFYEEEVFEEKMIKNLLENFIGQCPSPNALCARNVVK